MLKHVEVASLPCWFREADFVQNPLQDSRIPLLVSLWSLEDGELFLVLGLTRKIRRKHRKMWPKALEA